MARPKSIKSRQCATSGRTNQRHTLRYAFASANRRAHDRANRRMGLRQTRSIHAAIAEIHEDEGLDYCSIWRKICRSLAALALLPVCWITSWTLLVRFSHATLEQGFWQAPSFWYFSIGALFMVGWFWSGLAKSFFLYLYVLGHELTHAVFVKLCLGRVTNIHVSLEGGYITTNKTNWVIALSPYFVPFWSVIIAIFYAVARFGFDIADSWDLAFYGLMGASWTFHFLWTLWMIPRDQPDLRQNGTFLSLVIIYLANLLVLAALLCLAEGSPAANALEFGREWIRVAATAAVHGWQWCQDHLSGIPDRILLKSSGI